jgi:hypothetical protein
VPRKASVVVGALGAVVALGAGYVATAWRRYGRRPAGGPGDPLLDRFMPVYEVTEQHETSVAAPAATTYATACELDFRGSPLVRALFRVRRFVLEGQDLATGTARVSLPELQEMGWRILAEDPGREIVLGAVTQPWVADTRFRALSPEEFLSFAGPGHVKIAWTLAVEPAGAEASVFRTETRVATTDDEARRRFRRYWVTFAPGVRLVRRALLRAVRTEAERRHRLASARSQ